ncbi:MAG: hypothetical protein M1833_003203 [Piccolia ochrophora]|nr:MAG: hypothetical protein M1833_003203 [Piccolia ochrophora]
MGDVEKKIPEQTEGVPDLEELGERDGYVLDARDYQGGKDLKLARDGHTILIPQPSDDPHDPLNWSQFRKHVVLIIISCTAFLPDYGSATGAVTLLPQAEIWRMSEDEVNHSQVGNVFMLGAGGVFVVVFAAYFGRLPVFFWFMVVALATAAWCAGATSFESFMTARILNGFFSTVAQGGGLMFIKDTFFFHEHANFGQSRKINIWASFIILSPYFGPLIAAFMITTLEWEWPFWLYTIETGLCLIAIVLFVDETYYDRRISQADQPPRVSRVKRIIGIEQWHSRSQRNTFWQASMRPVKVILKPTVFLSNVYYMFTFAWVVGINTTLAIFVTPLYDFHPKQIGFFYFTPIVAAILGEIIGHWLHDLNAKRYLKSHGGRFEPEARLAVIWLSTPFMLAGLVLLGYSLQHAYHYMLTALGWGLYVFGTMITTVGVQAYNLDSYPEGSGEVAAMVNLARTLGGFIVSFFQVRWATAMGVQNSFGVQAGICAAVFFIIVFLQMYGKRLRQASGRLDFKTN